MKPPILCLFHALGNFGDSDKELHSSLEHYGVELVTAVSEVELLQEPIPVQTNLLMVLVQVLVLVLVWVLVRVPVLVPVRVLVLVRVRVLARVRVRALVFVPHPYKQLERTEMEQLQLDQTATDVPGL